MDADSFYVLTHKMAPQSSLIEEPIEQLKEVSVPGLSSKSLLLAFFPSALKEWKKGKILFENAQYGTLEYQMKGMGIEPIEFESFVVTSKFESQLNTSIDFKNPFKETINITLDYIPNDSNLNFISVSKTKNFIKLISSCLI
jgi:hypothetical protein